MKKKKKKTQELLYVEGKQTCNQEGKLTKQLVFIGPDYLQANLLSAKEGKVDEDLINALFLFNTPSISLPIIAWCLACFLKERIWKKTTSFPILNIHGARGSGKTKTMEHIIQPLFGLKSKIFSIGALTPFTLMKQNASTNTIPLIYDEYKQTGMTRSLKEAISRVLREIYDQLAGFRGRPDLTVVKYELVAPCAIAGEEMFVEPALKERIISISMDKETSKKYEKMFLYLRDERKKDLTFLGLQWLRYVMNLKDNEIYNTYDESYDQCKDLDIPDRIITNYCTLNTSLTLFCEFIENQGINISALKQAKLKQFRELMQITAAEDKSIVEIVIEDWYSMSLHEKQRRSNQQTTQILQWLNEGEDYIIDEANKTITFPVNKLYSRYQEWRKAINTTTECLDQLSLTQQLQKESFFIHSKAVRFGDNVLRSYICDLKKMQHLNIPSWLGKVGLSKKEKEKKLTNHQ